MALSNIEKFDELVGEMFAVLYAAFPLPKALLAKYFVPDGNVYTPGGINYGELTCDAEFFMATGRWLINAGYIEAQESGGCAFVDALLTAKGLETLKAVPGSLQGKAPLGEQLVDAAKTEGREALRSLVSQALGIGLQLFVK